MYFKVFVFGDLGKGVLFRCESKIIRPYYPNKVKIVLKICI